ncbi:NUDIX domain-containing protein [Niallia sp. NCCP-28]|uniref:NUDIX hydrolase n=1 Tax=Niallia sp. NCCP-28 TaxID=2934712 RepID=UPI002081D142|nr:NUDIX domain-containing protein [Niallia sp. NCCP-28]GKU82741.1 putative Nudix hydrolase [Niallia sp. NCCP-28]
MEQELITIYDENLTEIGSKSRKEIHEKGYWHKTFHCWILLKEQGRYSIYLQLRSGDKKDYPDLFDITAAGHLMAHETVEDGIREVKEELGIDIKHEDLISLGVVKNTIQTNRMIDNEFSHLYLCVFEKEPPFCLQKEEVAGIVKGDFADFYQLCIEEQKSMKVERVTVSADNKIEDLKKLIGKADFVPHEESYFRKAASLMKQYLDRK